MSWADNLQDAAFKGVKFDVQRERMSAERDTASHSYPYMDGEDIEDLGRTKRVINLTAIIWGDDYETKLQALLKVLDSSGPGELIHPVYGSVPNTQLKSYEIGHDAENPDACSIELRFEEATKGNPFFVQQLPAQKAAAVSATTEATRANGIAAFGSALDGLKSVKGGLSRLNALRDVMTGTLGAIRGQVQGVIGTALDIIQYPQAFASDIVGYLSGMSDLRSFDVGTMMSDWKNLFGQLDNTIQLPAGLNSGTATASSAEGTVPVGVPSVGDPASPSPVQASLEPVGALPADVAVVTAVIRVAAATQLADTASTILADEADEPTLSPAEIELIVNDVRTVVEAAIDEQRTLYPVTISRPIVEGLKDMALAIQTAAIAVITARPPLVQRTVDLPGNFHLTAFRWYGDFRRAAELARLNPQIINPNFLMPGDVLNAYSQ